MWARASSLALFFTSGRMWKFRFLGGAALQRCIKDFGSTTALAAELRELNSPTAYREEVVR